MIDESGPSIRIRALEEEVSGRLDEMTPDEQAQALQAASRSFGRRALDLVATNPGPEVNAMVHGIAQDANWLVSRHIHQQDH